MTSPAKAGCLFGGIFSQSPARDPLNEAVPPQGCVPSPDSFPFIFNPFFGHNVRSWNSCSSLPAPIRKLGGLFLVFLLYFWETPQGGLFARTPAHRGWGCGLTSPLRPSLLAEDARFHQPFPMALSAAPLSFPGLGLLAHKNELVWVLGQG